jgi:hypothetical protein
VANIRKAVEPFRGGFSDAILCCFSGYWMTKIIVKTKRQNFFCLYFHHFSDILENAESHDSKGFQAIRKITSIEHVDLLDTNRTDKKWRKPLPARDEAGVPERARSVRVS